METKSTSSATQYGLLMFNNQESETKVNDFDVSMRLVKDCIVKQAELEKRVDLLEKQAKIQNDYYLQGAKMSKTVRCAFTFIMIVPLVQLILCGVLYHRLSEEYIKTLPGLLRWYLSYVSIASVIEVLLFPVKVYFDKKKMEELETKIKETNK